MRLVELKNVKYRNLFAFPSSICSKSSNFATAFRNEADTPHGEMVEWSITTVLKTVVPRGTGGSNPSLSAKDANHFCGSHLFIYQE